MYSKWETGKRELKRWKGNVKYFMFRLDFLDINCGGQRNYNLCVIT